MLLLDEKKTIIRIDLSKKSDYLHKSDFSIFKRHKYKNSLLSNINNNGNNKEKTKCLKTWVGIFRVGIFWMGIIWGEFERWEFSWYPFRFVYKSFIKFAFCLLRLFVFLPAFILKTLAFQYKHKVIFGRSVSRSLVYSVSFFIYIFASKIKVSFFW